MAGCTVHHIIPLEYEGSWDLDNLILLADQIHKAVHLPNDHWVNIRQCFTYEVIQEIEKLRKVIQKHKDRFAKRS